MIEIVSGFTGAVLYKCDCTDVREAVVKAVEENANLYGANLNGANLTRANLYGANLTRANLYGANLDGANLDDDTNLPTGETWKEYREVILPTLCTAAGKSLEEVAEAWDCHDWSNCPMNSAFDFDGQFDGPNVSPQIKLLRPRIEQFVQLFDAKLLPCPCEVAATEATPAN